MNRKNFTDELGPFFSAVRAANRRAVLRTDLIVGWPTETEEERYASLDFAGGHFDEIATYTIELSPDLPAWKYQDQAFSPERLAEILKESREYLRRFDVFAHSGQQDDNTMMSAEQQRRNLRARKARAGAEVLVPSS